jgi:hypothetical protein
MTQTAATTTSTAYTSAAGINWPRWANRSATIAAASNTTNTGICVNTAAIKYPATATPSVICART